MQQDKKPERSENGITIVCSNIRCQTDGDKGPRYWTARAPLLLQTVNRTKPDIIGMQEARLSQLRWLVEQLSDYDVVAKAREGGDNPETCPVFFRADRFDCVDSGSFWLSDTPDVMSKGWNAACYRICSYAVLRQKADGKLLAVFNTHLDHISEKARINGIRLVLEKMEAFGSMPGVLMGDFNTYEDSDTYRAATAMFDDAKYQTADSDRGATYHAYGEALDEENIDYFMISKTGIAVRQYRVLRDTYDGVYPSDHFPIMIKIALS